MSNLEIELENSDAAREFDQTHEAYERYKALCLKIFNKITEVNGKSNMGMAKPFRTYDEEDLLTLRGVGTPTIKDISYSEDSEERTYKVFVVGKNAIYFKRFIMVEKKDQPFVTDARDSRWSELMEAQGDLVGFRRAYAGDENGTLNTLQQAIDQSFRLAKQEPPITPEKLQTIRV